MFKASPNLCCHCFEKEAYKPITFSKDPFIIRAVPDFENAQSSYHNRMPYPEEILVPSGQNVLGVASKQRFHVRLSNPRGRGLRAETDRDGLVIQFWFFGLFKSCWRKGAITMNRHTNIAQKNCIEELKLH
ncbi:UNVERIFIED_CONTAM: hypothetical protein NCL1_18756 [Trichonephila clavipes]